MNRVLVHLLQRVFYPGLKVAPQSRWVDAYAALGTLDSFRVDRNGGSIAGVRVLRDAAAPGSGIVILAHPLSRKAKYWFGGGPLVAGYLARGYAVVAFDFNGFGESDRIDFRYWRDARAVIEMVMRGGSCGHLVVHGMSFGAFHIIPSLGTLPPGAGVVLENVSRSVYDYWKRWLVPGTLIRIAERVGVRDIREMNVREHLSRLTRGDLRLLFVGCGCDDITPVEEMRDLYAYAPEPKRFVEIEEAGHYEAATVNEKAYWNALGFVLEADPAAPQPLLGADATGRRPP